MRPFESPVLFPYPPGLATLSILYALKAISIYFKKWPLEKFLIYMEYCTNATYFVGEKCCFDTLGEGVKKNLND